MPEKHDVSFQVDARARRLSTHNYPTHRPGKTTLSQHHDKTTSPRIQQHLQHLNTSPHPLLREPYTFLKMKLFLLLLSATLITAYAGILLPLYTYPTTPQNSISPSWAATLSAISAHPPLPFHIIINISSGGPYPTNPPPEFSDWAHLLGLLNAGPSPSLLG
jgi:hypothetical protein